jgi:hypothetical protein
MKQRIFPFLIALSALAVSGSAAFYSITGLSKLFAGASTEVIIMASSLEAAKLVMASLVPLIQLKRIVSEVMGNWVGS